MRDRIHIDVRPHEVNAWDEVSAFQLAAYLEQATRHASETLGFDDAWYRESGTAWIVSKLMLAVHSPPHYKESLAIDTWASSLRHVRYSRDYEVRGLVGQLCATARVDWVYLDLIHGVPTRFSPTIPLKLSTGTNAFSLLSLKTTSTDLGLQHITFRRPYRYEADSMGHVNNRVYLAWLDDALDEALASFGLPLAEPSSEGLRLRGRWYTVHYLHSARPGDDLEIRSRLVSHAAHAALLDCHQEIICRTDGKVLIRCVSRQELLGLAESGVSIADLRALSEIRASAQE